MTHGCLRDGEDPFHHLVTQGVNRGPDTHRAWGPGLFFYLYASGVSFFLDRRTKGLPQSVKD